MTHHRQINVYLETKINPIFQQLISELIKERPKNILTYCKSWFDRKVKNSSYFPQDSDEDSGSEEETPNDTEIQQKKLKNKWYDQRRGICGEVYGGHHQWEQFQLPICTKKSTVNSRILFRLKELFLFKNFDDNDIWRLINAMQQEAFHEGTTVVKQGQTGNEIYIIDSGDLECFKQSVNGEQIYLKTLHQGEMFGEMAMMYNTPRTATVKAKTQTILFKLDRRTFYSIVNERNIRKRKVFQTAIQKIQLFKELEPEQKYKIQDLIKEVPVHLNQYIIREGKPHHQLYIIQSGKFVSKRKQKNGHEQILAHFKENDYFGQDCLISKHATAKESVLALTNGKIYAIQLESLERVIGPVEKILQRSIQVYERYKFKVDM